MNSRTSIRYSTFLLLLVFTAALALQAYAQMAGGEFAAKIEENTAKLKQYTHTQKTQVYFKGELRTTKLSQVHYDSQTGERVVVPMDTGDAEQQAGAGTRRQAQGAHRGKKARRDEGVRRTTGRPDAPISASQS